MKIIKVRPMFNAIVTTMDRYTEDCKTTGGLIDTKKQKGTVKEYQKVIAVGSTVRDIKQGDTVLINPSRYAVTKHEKGTLKDGVITDNPVVNYNIPTVEINGEEYMMLYDQDVRYVIEEFEDDSHKSEIYTPPTNVII